MKVLIPTDFSEGARAAFDYAFQMFSGFEGVQFYLLNSYEMPKVSSAGGVMMNLEEAMKKESERDLKVELMYIGKKYPGVGVITVSRYGTLENSVARTCNENNIDWVVMGTHGASGLRKAFFGSNTKKIIENVERPVIAVPYEWKYRPIQNVVYATDLKRLENPKSLQPVLKIIEHFQATIHIVYVADNARSIHLEAEVSKLPLYDVIKPYRHTFEVVESDDVAKGIQQFVDEIDSDLGVLIPKATTFWQKLFKGSVTEKLTFQTTRPILAVKDVKVL